MECYEGSDHKGGGLIFLSGWEAVTAAEREELRAISMAHKL